MTFSTDDRKKPMTFATRLSSRPRILKDLCRFHATGAKSLQRFPSRMPYGKMVAEAARYRLQPEMLRKARRVAETYSASDLQKLIADCERIGHAVGLSHVIRLLSVPPRNRDALQRKAIEEGWGVSRLDAEILKRYPGRRPHAGRRRRAPADAQDARVQISRICESWKRLSAALRVPMVGRKQPPLRWDLTPALRRQIHDADRVMRAMATLIANS